MTVCTWSTTSAKMGRPAQHLPLLEWSLGQSFLHWNSLMKSKGTWQGKTWIPLMLPSSGSQQPRWRRSSQALQSVLYAQGHGHARGCSGNLLSHPVEFKAAQADVVSAKHAKTQAKMHAYADLFMNILLVAAEVNDGMYLSSKKMLNAMNKLKASVIPKVYRPMQDLRAKFIKHWDSRERARACNERAANSSGGYMGYNPVTYFSRKSTLAVAASNDVTRGYAARTMSSISARGVCSEGKDLPWRHHRSFCYPAFLELPSTVSSMRLVSHPPTRGSESFLRLQRVPRFVLLA